MIGKIIQEKRKAAGLTQAQVADLLGVSPPAVNRWEKDLCYPDATLLAPLARLLHTNLNELFSFYDSLTDEERKLIVQHADKLLLAGDDEQLFLYMEENLRQNPSDGSLYQEFADLLYAKHILAKATNPLIYLDRMAEYYEMARTLLSDNSDDMLYTLASVYAELGDVQKMEERWERLRDTGYDKTWIHAELLYASHQYDKAIPVMEECVLRKVVQLWFHLNLMRDTYQLRGDSEKGSVAEEKSDQLRTLFELWDGFRSMGKMSNAVAMSEIDNEIIYLSSFFESLDGKEDKISRCPLFTDILTEESGEMDSRSRILNDIDKMISG